MSEQTTPSGPQARRPVLEMVQRIRAGATMPPGRAQTDPGPQGPIITTITRIRGGQPLLGPSPGGGSAQGLSGSQDFLIGLGVGVLAVVVVGALTFEIWAPKVAARIARSAGKGLIGGLGGTAGKGLLGFGIVNLGQMGAAGGRGQLLGTGGPAQGIISKIPRPLKGLTRA